MFDELCDKAHEIEHLKRVHGLLSKDNQEAQGRLDILRRDMVQHRKLLMDFLDRTKARRKNPSLTVFEQRDADTMINFLINAVQKVDAMYAATGGGPWAGCCQRCSTPDACNEKCGYQLH